VSRRPQQAAAQATALSVTPLLEFQAAEDFRYGPANASPAARQSGRGGERFFTSSQMFANQVLVRHPQQFRIRSTEAQLRCLAPGRWAQTDFTSRRVLFLLPSQALGNNVCTLLFLHAFHERWRPRELGVFCAQSTSDIYLQSGIVAVHSLWIGRKELKRWHHVIDLGQLESRRDIELWPVDMEADLLEAFGLAPSARFDGTARKIAAAPGQVRIGLLPLASSPLRTVPVETTQALVDGLAGQGTLTLCLNRHQQQGRSYAQALAGKLPDDVEVRDGFDSISALLQAVDGFDYIIAADSGPAHMSKLYGTPGVAVYTSAPGEVLQGRFSNLAGWTVPYQGPHCAAPCGLAKLRQTADGRIGCMGSLGVALEALPDTPKGRDAQAVQALMAEPVPCVRQLRDAPGDLVDFVRADLAARLPGAA